jgi:hypothetical protein
MGVGNCLSLDLCFLDWLAKTACRRSGQSLSIRGATAYCGSCTGPWAEKESRERGHGFRLFPSGASAPLFLVGASYWVNFGSDSFVLEIVRSKNWLRAVALEVKTALKSSSLLFLLKLLSTWRAKKHVWSCRERLEGYQCPCWFFFFLEYERLLTFLQARNNREYCAPLHDEASLDWTGCRSDFHQRQDRFKIGLEI